MNQFIRSWKGTKWKWNTRAKSKIYRLGALQPPATPCSWTSYMHGDTLIIMTAIWAGHYILPLWFLSSSFFFMAT